MSDSVLSIRRRLQLGALVVLAVFLFAAGLALRQMYGDHLRNSHFARLQSEIYLLLAASEIDQDGKLVLPASLAEPLFSLPQSGLYAQIDNPAHNEIWRSPSALGREFAPAAQSQTGVWRFDEQEHADRAYLQASYRVNWTIGGRQQALQFHVLEDRAQYAGQLATFQQALWLWLGGVGLLLLLVQSILLRWGLSPLRRVVRELARIARGEQQQLGGAYPAELQPLTARVNELLASEAARRVRYRDALGDLAHSLKTPLAVLRNALEESPASQLATEQLRRMDHIIQHQLARAVARSKAGALPRIALPAVAEQLLQAMRKVHQSRGIEFALDAPASLDWPLDEGDAYEVLGNVLDNAGKWARSRVQLRLALSEDGELQVEISDDGPGFAGQQAALLRGVRLDERVPGQGIGLAVVSDIVAAYDGQVEVAHSVLGGALVRIMLPRPDAGLA